MKRIIRQILGWGMMLTLPLMMTSCGELFDMLDNPITPALQVLRAQLTLKVGESKPIQASTQAHVVLLYSSDIPAVATVDATGLITAVSPGTARITIKAQGEDDYYRTEIFSENTTTVEVTVTKKDGSISFAEANIEKHKNDVAFNNPLTIVGDGVVSYTSDATAVASVNSSSGDVTILGPGTAIITATVTDGDDYTYKTTTAQYTITVDHIVTLNAIASDYIAQDGDVLTGTLAGNYKISIADGANVELKDVTINGVNDASYKWAGLTCLGNATITITGTNTVKGFYYYYPGIQAGPIGKTLTINGTGTLTATGGNCAAGIGSGFTSITTCGNIVINGGTITAISTGQGAGIGSGWSNSSGGITINGGTVTAISTGGGAGIGSGCNSTSCGDITISGGIVNASSSGDGAGIGSGFTSTLINITISGGIITASSGGFGAGIGSGYFSSYGSITITSGITQVQATANYATAWPIGKGDSDQGSTGAVTINGVTVTSKDWDGTGLSGSGLTLTGAGTNTWTLTSTTAP